MYDDEQDLLATAPRSLDPAQLVQLMRGPHGNAWIDGLRPGERLDVAVALQGALVHNELAGSYTTPDLLAAFARLGGSEQQLDDAVLAAAAAREVGPAGQAVVWSRLLRVQDALTETQVRSWLSQDMIRELAAKSATWSRFSALELGDWARKPAATPHDNSLAKHMIDKHPAEAGAVLAQAMREDPSGADRLADRIEARSPKTLIALAAAIVDDGTIPAGLRVTLAGRADDKVRARARDMVIRELGVSHEAMARLAPEDVDATAADEPASATPAAMRLAWVSAGIAFLFGSLLSFGFNVAFVLMLITFLIAWWVGRGAGADRD